MVIILVWIPKFSSIFAKFNCVFEYYFHPGGCLKMINLQPISNKILAPSQQFKHENTKKEATYTLATESLWVLSSCKKNPKRLLIDFSVHFKQYNRTSYRMMGIL